MSERVSGWIMTDFVHGKDEFEDDEQPIHVTEVPPDAIEGEGKVYPDYNPINAGSDSGEMLIGNLPAALIGKRVRYIIFEEDKA